MEKVLRFDRKPLRGVHCLFRGCIGIKICSGKLFLDTEGVIFVQKMYNERHENTYVVQTCPQARQEAAMKYTLEERLEIRRRIYDGEISRYEAA